MRQGEELEAQGFEQGQERSFSGVTDLRFIPSHGLFSSGVEEGCDLPV